MIRFMILPVGATRRSVGALIERAKTSSEGRPSRDAPGSRTLIIGCDFAFAACLLDYRNEYVFE
jgi:hypothetical protein